MSTLAAARVRSCGSPAAAAPAAAGAACPPPLSAQLSSTHHSASTACSCQPDQPTLPVAHWCACTLLPSALATTLRRFTPPPQADNFYFPPGWDPSKGSLNKVRLPLAAGAPSSRALRNRQALAPATTHSCSFAACSPTHPTFCRLLPFLPAVPGLPWSAGRPRPQAGLGRHPHHPL